MNAKSEVTFAMALFLVWAAAIPAQADSVIFSNLGAGDSYNGGVSYTLGTDDSGADYIVTASAFTVGATSASLSTIQVAAGIQTGANQLTVDLDMDSGGNPGAVIESLTVNGAMPPFGSVSSGDLVTATSVLHPLLTAGTQYWLVLSVPDDGSSLADWDLNSIGSMGPVAQYDNGTEFANIITTSGAMRIMGLTSSVPEPSSIVILSTAAVVLLGCGRRRRGSAKPD